MFASLRALFGCQHASQIRDTSIPGVLRLRCMDCLRVSEGVDLGTPRYHQTQPAKRTRLALTWGRQRRRRAA